MNTPEQTPTEELLQELTQTLDSNTSHDLAQQLLQRRTELVPLLIDKLEDPATWEAEGEAAAWLPLHAVTLLGIMRSGEAMPALLTALQKAAEFDHELVLEDLPAVFAQIGPSALEPLMEFLGEYRKDDWSRPPAAHGLAGIAYLYPETREQVLAFLHGLLTAPEEQDSGFLGSMAVDLLELADPVSLSLLDEAFAAGRVSEAVIGRSAVNRARQQGPDEAELQYRFRRNLLDLYAPEDEE